LPARTADESDARTLAYPYPLIGRIADEVRVMAYDHSYSTSTPGSVAPLSWVEAVVSYAVDRIPRARLMLGLAIYGYDWTETSGQDIGGADAARLAARYGLQPRWDGATASWTFVYEQDGQRHTVWYEDARSIEAKQQVAIRNRLRGLGIWRIGGEDPQLWTAVAHAAAGSAP
jgi:spore germination protein